MTNPRKATTARPQIGRFLLTRKLGKGGQGTVYLAEDPSLERQVAIKVVHAESLSEELEPGTLPREARMAARMQHPSIVSIFDVGHFRGRPYLVFEFVEGRTFKEILKAEGAMPASRALALIRPVLLGMAHAHERDVLHLDLTPGNVLLSKREVPQIMDFGLAQFVTAVRDTTAMPVGTLLYMAPEQLEERPVGPPCDVRSLGLILYELLTGETAISGRTIHQAASEICEKDIDLSAVETGADMVPVRDFLAGALERDPDGRYPNAVAMLQAFDVAMESRAAIERTAYGKPVPGAVEFLIRRMQRRQDFPALSRSLVEVNRMTSKDSNATASQLATVVLRDFALTNKLLKLANSAFYGVLAGEVKSVSHAISLLGFEQLRVTANSLTLFSHIKDRTKSRGLKELLIRSFVAGLVARHVAQRDNLGYAEEAFICGMFQTLGETLTMFYFAEEYVDVLDLVAQGHLTRHQATIQILGADFSSLGAAIAREWRFPKVIVEAIAGLPDDEPISPPVDDAQRLRDVSVFADKLCEVLGGGAHDQGPDVFAPLHKRFAASISMKPEELVSLAESALAKLESQSAILGVNTRASTWCDAARACFTDAAREKVDLEATVKLTPAELENLQPPVVDSGVLESTARLETDTIASNG